MDHIYKSFISYSHKDQKWASWLHRKLESYKFPKQTLKVHSHVPPNLRPVFRDREELAAGHNLGEKIEAALIQSENLIIICSPDAAKSHWVNQEVLFFKRHNRGAKIFSVIVAGEPFAEDATEECFPEALRFDVDPSGELSERKSEPLAADLRDAGDGKRLGLLKLCSGMVGIGVNDLVQRDLQRARRRVTAITAAASLIVLVMGMLTWTAFDAQQEAEQRRASAESLVEFMLTELQEKLRPIGRTDTLSSISSQAIAYYESEFDDDISCESLARFAKASHMQASSSFDMGKSEKLKRITETANNVTSQLQEKCLERPDRFLHHAQSLYFSGLISASENRDDEYLVFTQARQHLIGQYCEIYPQSDDCIYNTAKVQIDLGNIFLKSSFRNTDEAKKSFQSSIKLLEKTKKFRDFDFTVRKNHADLHAWIAEMFILEQNYAAAEDEYTKVVELLRAIQIQRQKGASLDELSILNGISEGNLGLVKTLLKSNKLTQAKTVLTMLGVEVEQLISIDPNSHMAKRVKTQGLVLDAILELKSGDRVRFCQSIERAREFQNSVGDRFDNIAYLLDVFSVPSDFACSEDEK